MGREERATRVYGVPMNHVEVNEDEKRRKRMDVQDGIDKALSQSVILDEEGLSELTRGDRLTDEWGTATVVHIMCARPVAKSSREREKVV
jgi:hypothetical protein